MSGNMRQAIPHLGSFGVIEPIQITYQIAGDASDTFKPYALTNQRIVCTLMYCAFACCIVMETRHKLFLVQTTGGFGGIAILLVQGIVQIGRSICHDHFLHEILLHDVLKGENGGILLILAKMEFYTLAVWFGIRNSSYFGSVQR